MDDLGAPGSFLTLAKGTPVLTSDGERIGEVAHVLAAEEEDIFDGIVVAAVAGGHRFVDAPQVEEIYERGVVLNIDAGEAAGLPEPSANPAAMEVGPADLGKTEMKDRLRRAWQVLKGE
jgi:hypothetical protein